MHISQSSDGVISIAEEKRFDDGSVEISYSLDEKALDICAEEYEKEVKDLTEKEIYEFVQKNLGLAIKGHDGWRAIKK